MKYIIYFMIAIVYTIFFTKWQKKTAKNNEFSILQGDILTGKWKKDNIQICNISHITNERMGLNMDKKVIAREQASKAALVEIEAVAVR